MSFTRVHIAPDVAVNHDELLARPPRRLNEQTQASMMTSTGKCKVFKGKLSIFQVSNRSNEREISLRALLRLRVITAKHY